MRSHLLIRPGHTDHLVVESLLAPGGSGIFRSAPVVSHVVADARVAIRRPTLAEAAAGAGVPFIVDPQTHLLQANLAQDDPWAALPFGTAAALDLDDLRTATARNDLVRRVVAFQLQHRATAVIPPYVYANAPTDEWFELGLDLLQRTASHLTSANVRLPVVPLLCAQLQHFALTETWADGIDRFAKVAQGVNPQFVGLCLSPAGAATDGYGKVHRLFAAAMRLRSAGMAVVAWRQGVYGPSLVAAGLDGYETGIASSERTDIAALISRRRPRATTGAKPQPTWRGIYLQPLGRSVAVATAEHLLDDLTMRAKIVCDDEHCCPDGMRSMTAARREHSIRARARYLADLDQMPMSDWRLFRISRDAQEAVTLTLHANQILARAQETPTVLQYSSAEALAQVADHLLEARMPRGA
jgi:hypothetical protein